MPYDEDLAKMRAEMLMQERQPLYDDGASMLGNDAYAQQVGLFGKGPKRPTFVEPPVNVSRRNLFGLPSGDAQLPAVRGSEIPSPIPTPQTSTPQTPSAPAPTPQAPVSSNPLGQLADKALNTPMSRRQILQRAGSAALQQALPTPGAADVAKEIASPLTNAITSAVTETTPTMPPAIAAVIRDMLKERMNDVAEYGEEEIPLTVEKYLGYAPDLDPALKDDIAQQLKQYDDMLNENQDIDMYDDLRDAQQEFSMYLDPLVDRMPGDKAWEELTGHEEFTDYLNEHGVKDLVKQFRESGATKDEVLDFLDQYYPGFDVNDADDLRMIDGLYTKRAKTKGK